MSEKSYNGKFRHDYIRKLTPIEEEPDDWEEQEANEEERIKVEQQKKEIDKFVLIHTGNYWSEEDSKVLHYILSGAKEVAEQKKLRSPITNEFDLFFPAAQTMSNDILDLFTLFSYKEKPISEMMSFFIDLFHAPRSRSKQTAGKYFSILALCTEALAKEFNQTKGSDSVISLLKSIEDNSCLLPLTVIYFLAQDEACRLILVTECLPIILRYCRASSPPPILLSCATTLFMLSSYPQVYDRLVENATVFDAFKELLETNVPLIQIRTLLALRNLLTNEILASIFHHKVGMSYLYDVMSRSMNLRVIEETMRTIATLSMSEVGASSFHRMFEFINENLRNMNRSVRNQLAWVVSLNSVSLQDKDIENTFPLIRTILILSTYSCGEESQNNNMDYSYQKKYSVLCYPLEDAMMDNDVSYLCIIALQKLLFSNNRSWEDPDLIGQYKKLLAANESICGQDCLVKWLRLLQGERGSVIIKEIIQLTLSPCIPTCRSAVQMLSFILTQNSFIDRTIESGGLLTLCAQLHSDDSCTILAAIQGVTKCVLFLLNRNGSNMNKGNMKKRISQLNEIQLSKKGMAMKFRSRKSSVVDYIDSLDVQGPDSKDPEAAIFGDISIFEVSTQQFCFDLMRDNTINLSEKRGKNLVRRTTSTSEVTLSPIEDVNDIDENDISYNSKTSVDTSNYEKEIQAQEALIAEQYQTTCRLILGTMSIVNILEGLFHVLHKKKHHSEIQDASYKAIAMLQLLAQTEPAVKDMIIEACRISMDTSDLLTMAEQNMQKIHHQLSVGMLLDPLLCEKIVSHLQDRHKKEVAAGSSSLNSEGTDTLNNNDKYALADIHHHIIDIFPDNHSSEGKSFCNNLLHVKGKTIQMDMRVYEEHRLDELLRNWKTSTLYSPTAAIGSVIFKSTSYNQAQVVMHLNNFLSAMKQQGSILPQNLNATMSDINVDMSLQSYNSKCAYTSFFMLNAVHDVSSSLLLSNFSDITDQIVSFLVDYLSYLVTTINHNCVGDDILEEYYYLHDFLRNSLSSFALLEDDVWQMKGLPSENVAESNNVPSSSNRSESSEKFRGFLNTDDESKKSTSSVSDEKQATETGEKEEVSRGRTSEVFRNSKVGMYEGDKYTGEQKAKTSLLQGFSLKSLFFKKTSRRSKNDSAPASPPSSTHSDNAVNINFDFIETAKKKTEETGRSPNLPPLQINPSASPTARDEVEEDNLINEDKYYTVLRPKDLLNLVEAMCKTLIDFLLLKHSSMSLQTKCQLLSVLNRSIDLGNVGHKLLTHEIIEGLLRLDANPEEGLEKKTEFFDVKYKFFCRIILRNPLMLALPKCTESVSFLVNHLTEVLMERNGFYITSAHEFNSITLFTSTIANRKETPAPFLLLPVIRLLLTSYFTPVLSNMKSAVFLLIEYLFSLALCNNNFFLLEAGVELGASYINAIKEALGVENKKGDKARSLFQFDIANVLLDICIWCTSILPLSSSKSFLVNNQSLLHSSTPSSASSNSTEKFLEGNLDCSSSSEALKRGSDLSSSFFNETSVSGDRASFFGSPAIKALKYDSFSVERVQQPSRLIKKTLGLLSKVLLIYPESQFSMEKFIQMSIKLLSTERVEISIVENVFKTLSVCLNTSKFFHRVLEGNTLRSFVELGEKFMDSSNVRSELSLLLRIVAFFSFENNFKFEKVQNDQEKELDEKREQVKHLLLQPRIALILNKCIENGPSPAYESAVSTLFVLDIWGYRLEQQLVDNLEATAMQGDVNIRTHAAWLLSSATVRSRNNIEQAQGLLHSLCMLLEARDTEVRNQALWAFAQLNLENEEALGELLIKKNTVVRLMKSLIHEKKLIQMQSAVALSNVVKCNSLRVALQEKGLYRQLLTLINDQFIGNIYATTKTISEICERDASAVNYFVSHGIGSVIQRSLSSPIPILFLEGLRAFAAISIEKSSHAALIPCFEMMFNFFEDNILEKCSIAIKRTPLDEADKVLFEHYIASFPRIAECLPDDYLHNPQHYHYLMKIGDTMDVEDFENEAVYFDEKTRIVSANEQYNQEKKNKIGAKLQELILPNTISSQTKLFSLLENIPNEPQTDEKKERRNFLEVCVMVAKIIRMFAEGPAKKIVRTTNSLSLLQWICTSLRTAECLEAAIHAIGTITILATGETDVIESGCLDLVFELSNCSYHNVRTRVGWLIQLLSPEGKKYYNNWKRYNLHKSLSQEKDVLTRVPPCRQRSTGTVLHPVCDESTAEGSHIVPSMELPCKGGGMRIPIPPSSSKASTMRVPNPRLKKYIKPTRLIDSSTNSEKMLEELSNLWGEPTNDSSTLDRFYEQQKEEMLSSFPHFQRKKKYY